MRGGGAGELHARLTEALVNSNRVLRARMGTAKCAKRERTTLGEVKDDPH